MKRFFAVICLALLLLACFSVVNAEGDTPSIELSHRWTKSTLRALTFVNQSEPWWQSYFVDLTQNAITQWNQALQYLATNYQDYAYMGAVDIVSEVSNQTLPGYDIYVSFIESIPLGGNDALGLTTTKQYKNGTVDHVLVELSSNSKNVALTGSNQRDVVGHELGHALGLGHSNSSSDMMYPYYDLYSSQNAISTLDLFGLATAFSWLTSAGALEALPGFVVLPPTLPFLYAPITDPTAKSAGDNPLVRTVEMLLGNIYTTVMVIVFLVFIIIVGLVYVSMGKKRRKAPRMKNTLHVGHTLKH